MQEEGNVARCYQMLTDEFQNDAFLDVGREWGNITPIPI